MAPQRSKTTPCTTSSRSSHRSDESHDSHSTALSSVHSSPHPAPRYPRARQFSYDAELSPASSERSSTETYASTVASLQELFEEPEETSHDYDLPEYLHEHFEPSIRPSTAQEFARYFPTTNRLSIRHDGSTYDGNMNLRVDTEVSSKHGKEQVQLFHMRMHDLRTREFSLRRYCRESGREVCRSSRKKPAKPAFSEARPGLQRSVSNALASIRKNKPDFKRTSSALSAKAPRRKDSGYGSCEDYDSNDGDDVASFTSSSPGKSELETNVTKLEFSNYAHVNVKCGSKKYDFEYWGRNYAWKRIFERGGQSRTTSYHLVKSDGGPVLARIVPELRSPAQVKAEERAGGWIPSCSMWMCDQNILNASNLTDVADVIVATGLTALIDDSIKRRFPPEHRPSHTLHIGVPLTPLQMDMEYVGPKAMMEHVFKRRHATGTSLDTTRHSPLKYAKSVKAC